MDSLVFEKMEPTKLFFRCAIPSMITMVFQALYQMADGLFVGQFIGEDALAAVNLIMPIIMIVFATSNMIAIGSSVRISILLGEKKQEEASQVFSFSLKIILLISCVVGVFGFLYTEEIVYILFSNATEKAIEYSCTYLKIYAFFAPVMPLGFATDNYLRACGKEKESMWIGISSQTLNIILDIILIAFLHQGVAAVAFTSCISMALSSIISLYLFRNKKLALYYTNKNISFSKFLSILLNGSSEFFNNISMSVMALVYNYFLLKYGQTTGVAAFSVIMYVDSIIGMLVFGMCDSLQPAISYCYGAQLIDKVKALFRRVILGAIALSILSMLFMRYFGQYAALIFVRSEDAGLLVISIEGMRLFALTYLTGWVDMCFSSFFTALQKPIRSLITSFFGTLVFPILFLFILTPYFQLNGVWYASIASCSASAIVAILLALSLKIKGL